MIAQTSLDAYLQMQEIGRLSANERIVLDVFELYPEGRTNFEIAQILNWSINRVTGRTNSLVKKGRLFAARKKVNIYSGCINTVWVASKHKPLYEDLGFSQLDSGDGSLGSVDALSPLLGPSLNAPSGGRFWKDCDSTSGLAVDYKVLPDNNQLSKNSEAQENE